MIITESPHARQTRLLSEAIADWRDGRGDHRAIYRRHALRLIADDKRRRREAWERIRAKSWAQFKDAAE